MMAGAAPASMPSKPPMQAPKPRMVPDKMPAPKMPDKMPSPMTPPKGMSAMANPDAPGSGGYSPGQPAAPSIRTVPDKVTITPSPQPAWPSKAPATSTPGTKPDDKL